MATVAGLGEGEGTGLGDAGLGESTGLGVTGLGVTGLGAAGLTGKGEGGTDEGAAGLAGTGEEGSTGEGAAGLDAAVRLSAGEAVGTAGGRTVGRTAEESAGEGGGDAALLEGGTETLQAGTRWSHLMPLVQKVGSTVTAFYTASPPAAIPPSANTASHMLECGSGNNSSPPGLPPSPTHRPSVM